MKVLLDENLPHELRPLLMTEHEVFTVTYLGWSGLKNGELLAKAVSEDFAVLITNDQGIEHQQSVKSLRLAIVVLRAKTNKPQDLRPLVPAILLALASIKPRSLIKIG